MLAEGIFGCFILLTAEEAALTKFHSMVSMLMLGTLSMLNVLASEE